jgi:hypothetical protein
MIMTVINFRKITLEYKSGKPNSLFVMYRFKSETGRLHSRFMENPTDAMNSLCFDSNER